MYEFWVEAILFKNIFHMFWKVKCCSYLPGSRTDLLIPPLPDGKEAARAPGPRASSVSRLGFMIIASDTDLCAVNGAGHPRACVPTSRIPAVKFKLKSASRHYYARRAAWLIPKRLALRAPGELLALYSNDGWTGPLCVCQQLWKTPNMAAN